MAGDLIAYLLSKGAPPSVIDRMITKMDEQNEQPIGMKAGPPRVGYRGNVSALKANPVGRA